MAEIKVSGVGKLFSGSSTWALRGIDLSVLGGDLTSILGASGSGKSTLLRIIGGLTPASEGRVSVDGRFVDGPPDRLVYVFQQYGKSLFPWKTAMDNVAFGVLSRATATRRPRRGRADLAAARDEALQQLQQVGLRGSEHKYPHQLSGGMQQRIAIARAVAARPDVLLMDEPFSAVDALTRMELQDLMLRIWEDRGLTVVFVTHDIEEALYLSDRVAVLSNAGQGMLSTMPVDLPRPRDQVLTRETGQFASMRRTLLGMVARRASEVLGGERS